MEKEFKKRKTLNALFQNYDDSFMRAMNNKCKYTHVLYNFTYSKTQPLTRTLKIPPLHFQVKNIRTQTSFAVMNGFLYVAGSNRH